jgi:hypothetical protein
MHPAQRNAAESNSTVSHFDFIGPFSISYWVTALNASEMTR